MLIESISNGFTLSIILTWPKLRMLPNSKAVDIVSADEWPVPKILRSAVDAPQTDP